MMRKKKRKISRENVALIEVYLFLSHLYSILWYPEVFEVNLHD